MSATVARPRTNESAHFYQRDGTPCHTVIGSTTGRERPTTIADARKLGLLPSVTNILRVLHKEALVQWKIEQAVLACVTSPRKPEEPLDAFIERILHTEKVQDQEAAKARDMGLRIHQALEDELSGRSAEQEMLPWIEPVWDHLNNEGLKVICTESVLVGDGYAGRVDLIQGDLDEVIITDFKTSKSKLPKDPYIEAKLQLAAYAKAWENQNRNRVRVRNIYISTVNPGEFVCHEFEWPIHYSRGFIPLLSLWQHLNDYNPSTALPTSLGKP